jgi:hypothetical protein
MTLTANLRPKFILSRDCDGVSLESAQPHIQMGTERPELTTHFTSASLKFMW